MNTTYPDEPGFKTHATETSRDAARSMVSRASTLRTRCLTVLKGASMTADEVAAALGETVLSVRPRISELCKMGKVSETSDRRPNASGKSAVVWQAVVPAPPTRLEQVKLL